MSNTRILILSEGFGSGHTQAGRALAAGISKLCPDTHTKVLELGTFLNPVIAPWILSAYRVTLNTSPALIGMFYRSKYEKPVGRLTRLALHKMFYQHAQQVIEDLAPDVIICTHPIPNAIIARLKASGMDIPLYTLITDYDAHASWISPEVNCYLVSTPEVRDLLLQRGVRPEHVIVTGIPVHPDFWSAQDQDTARKELGLKQMPTALVMGGGWGLMLKDELLDKLASWREHVQIVCCMGNNHKGLQKLRSHHEFQHENIRIIGHTNEISKWMDAADLLITKPGGMTCTEGLAKRIPMLFYESIPGQEEKNCEYFVSHGYGVEISSLDIIDEWFQYIVNRTSNPGSPFLKQKHLSHIAPGYKPDRCAKLVLASVTNGTTVQQQYAYL